MRPVSCLRRAGFRDALQEMAQLIWQALIPAEEATPRLLLQHLQVLRERVHAYRHRVGVERPKEVSPDRHRTCAVRWDLVRAFDESADAHTRERAAVSCAKLGEIRRRLPERDCGGPIAFGLRAVAHG